jgi:GAF domain-containing protein
MVEGSWGIDMTMIDGRTYRDNVFNVSEQTNLLADIIGKIRGLERERDLLDTAVKSIRQAIGCDRAVVYSLQSANQGEIVAESVVAGYQQTIGTKIVDPCFAARYIDKYQMGRVRAIDNIYQAGMTPCYIENLEQISVKASLVVPLLINANTLHGLLVLHQCDAPRQWQQPEIDLTIHTAIQVGLMLEHIAQRKECDRLQRELAQVNDWQQKLPQIEQRIYSGSDRQQILQATVAQTQSLLDCDRVVVYSLYPNSIGKIIAEVTKPALAPLLGRTIVDPCFEYRYTEQYQNGRVRAIDNIHTAGMTACYIETLTTIGVKSNLVAPIVLADGRLLGLLVAHECFEYRAWTASDIDAVRQIAMHCGLALLNGRMREKQQLMAAATKMLDRAKTELHQAIECDRLTTAAETELAAIFNQIASLSRLLQQETTESTQDSPEEAQRLLQIIAKRLQDNLDRWQLLRQELVPQQVQLTAVLTSALSSLDRAVLK